MRTNFFRYDELTWPEVEALPRSTPLVLPLGQGYPPTRLSAALGSPERVGLLPSLPFGWAGSGLPVPESILSQLVHNLLDGLREEGFSRLFALTPQGIGLGLGNAQISLAQPSDGREWRLSAQE